MNNQVFDLSRRVFCVLFISIVNGQFPIVSQIGIRGHEITKEYVIRREIKHQVGVPLDTALAIADRDRIENLGIFSQVLWDVIPLEDRTVLLRFMVVESWRILPAVLPLYEEETGWSLSSAVILSNFRGRNESLEIAGQIGGRWSQAVEFYDPWISGDHISLYLAIERSSHRHLYLPFDVGTTSAKVAVGRYFGYQKKTNFSLEIATKSFSDDLVNHEFKYIAPASSFAYDTRDIYVDPSKGVYIKQSILGMFTLGGEKTDLLFWTQSYSYFQSLLREPRKLVLGFNLNGLLTLGDLREEWMNYIGGAYSVRGWEIPSSAIFTSGNRDYRFGYHWLVTSIELRQTIIPKYATKFRNEFGLSLVGFIDAGLTTRSLNDLVRETPLIGVGVGLRIPWPIIQIIRLDYGWAFYKGQSTEHSFHLAFGQKF